MAAVGETRPLGELFAELAKETATLVRHEAELAKVELTAKAKRARYEAIQVAIGGVIALLGALALVAAVVLILARVIDLWASALIVGSLLGVLGTWLAVLGVRAFQHLDPAPRETIQTFREDKQWLREQVTR